MDNEIGMTLIYDGGYSTIMERFVLVQNKVARFATEEEFLVLTELVENKKSLVR